MIQEENELMSEEEMLQLMEYWIQFGIDARKVRGLPTLEKIQYASQSVPSVVKARLMVIQNIIHEMTVEGLGLNKDDDSKPKVYGTPEKVFGQASRTLLDMVEDDFPHRETFERMKLVPFCVEKLRRVKKLALKLWGKEEIPPFFHLLSDFENLTISDASYTQIPETILQMRSLRELHLTSWFKLGAVPESIAKLQFLEKVNFSGCEALRLLPPAFVMLKNLKHVDLSGTGFQDIPAVVLSNPSIEILEMDCCSNMVKIDQSIVGMQNLRVLKLRDGIFREIPQIMGLEELDLFRCGRLSSFMTNPGQFKNLKRLELGETNVTISMESWDFPELEDFSISNLARWPDMCNLPKLRKFIVCKLHADTLPSFIYQSGLLEDLRVWGAPNLFEIDDALCKLKNLEILDLRQCPVRCLPNDLATLTMLTHLNLVECPGLTHLPSGWKGSERLVHIILRGSRIRNIPPEITNLESVRLLVDANGAVLKNAAEEESMKNFLKIFTGM